MAVVTEYITKFSFQGSLNPLERFNAGYGRAISLAATGATILAGAAVGLLAMSANTLQANKAMVQFADTTGLNIERLQMLQYAAEASGASAAAMDSSLSSLTSHIGSAARQGSEDFARLGISIRDAGGNLKSADTVLLEVSDRFKSFGFSRAQQRNFASALGIDDTLLPLLSKSRAEIAGLMGDASRFGLVTAADAEQIAKYNKALVDRNRTMQSLRNEMALALSPTVIRLTERFTELLSANRELREDGFGAVATVVDTVVERFGATAKAIDDLVTNTVGWRNAIAGLLIVFLPGVALVAAGVLIIDDLITAAQGGQSVIRDFFMEFLGVDIAPILQKAYEDLKNFIADVKDLGTAFPVSGEAISTSIDLLKRGELQLFLGGTEDEYRQIAATSPDSSERDLAITQLKLSRIKQYGALNTYLNRDEIARLEGKEAGLTAGIEQRDARMGKGYEDLMRNYEASIAPFDRNSLLLLGQPGANSSREVNQDININIYSNDPRTTGDYVVGALKDAEGQAWASLPEVSR